MTGDAVEAISRRQAKELGRRHYFTGRPCLNGHIAKRFVNSARCFQCLRASNLARHERYGQIPERKEYERAYYQRVKEKVRAIIYLEKYANQA